MEIIELNADNISDYEDILNPDVAENIGREFYRGLVAEDGAFLQAPLSGNIRTWKMMLIRKRR